MCKDFLVYDPYIKEVITQYRLYKNDVLISYTCNNIIKHFKKRSRLIKYNITEKLLHEV